MNTDSILLDLVDYYSQLGRYSFLGAGVLYGTYNQGRLEKVEAKARVIEAAKKEKRDVQLAAEKKRSAEGLFIFTYKTFNILICFICLCS